MAEQKFAPATGIFLPPAGGKEFHVKHKIFVIIFVLVAAAVLAACSRSAATVTPYRVPISATLTPTATKVAVAQETAPPQGPAATKTPGPQAPTATPVAEATNTPTATAQAVAVEESSCPLKDKGIQVDFEKTPDKDGFYILSGSMKELQLYAGCNFLVEGRKVLVEEHHIWVFFDTSWTLKIREGSLWVYPEEWNMGDFSTEKPPIAAEFVTAKRHNQKANGYDWVIYVHVGTQTYEFPAGQDTPVVKLPNNADFVDPEVIEIHGIWDSKSTSFNASIGAEGATTVALLDGELVFWANAQDNVLYKSAEAWLMPSSWSKDQVEAWAKAQFPEKELRPYKPAD